MVTVGEMLGLSKQNEVLLLTLLGICCTIFDASIFNIHTNLYRVWELKMDPLKFTYIVQLYIKYIISSIVIVRTFTVHLYLAFYIVMLWPAIFEERPGLLLPWLFVGSIKCLAMGVMCFSTGLYVCMAYRFSKAACWHFLITQIMDHGPSIYMWFCVLSYYKDLKLKALKIYPMRPCTPSTMFSLSERRRRVRGYAVDDQKLNNSISDERQLISTSALDTLIQQLQAGLGRGVSRSLDSLLTKMSVEAKNEELMETTEESEEDNTLSVKDKVLKSLHITPSFIERIKARGRVSEPIHKEQPKAVKKSIPSANPMKDGRKIKSDFFYNPSETEIRTIHLCDGADDPSLKSSQVKPSLSKLPRPKKEIKDAETSFSTQALIEKQSRCTHCTPEKIVSQVDLDKVCSQRYVGVAARMNSKRGGSSYTAPVTGNRPTLIKSKSQMHKSETIKTPPVFHVTFKHDGYTLAYLERIKTDEIKQQKLTPKSLSKEMK